jgi:hypothetical protein
MPFTAIIFLKKQRLKFLYLAISGILVHLLNDINY